MRGAIPPFPQYVLMAWCLVKYRDNFTFNFTFYHSDEVSALENHSVPGGRGSELQRRYT
jgi:hypothetical protein